MSLGEASGGMQKWRWSQDGLAANLPAMARFGSRQARRSMPSHERRPASSGRQ
eukprot:CAMPEP_0185411778 /NCGR_PEP_ID=MMETSP1365-20130426/3751_1 /TAXON_ID=38817 /ORGANISM="Gephyrocapsa oceanica, Strain RCC1303" /LENGTH=52 /DNA_ID=CAMNT_0028014403 /DNA_START=407 /DNA_END=562 /DNA_ORIENTATION=+